MKNKLFIFTCIAVCIAFVSCSDDDDNGNKDQEVKKELTYVKYNIGDMGDLIDLVDINIEYLDDKGEVQSESITKLPWSKEYINKRELPVELRMTLTYTKKVPRPEKDRYIIKRTNQGYEYKVDGGTSSKQYLDSSKSYSKDDIDAYLDNLIAKGTEYKVSLEE